MTAELPSPEELDALERRLRCGDTVLYAQDREFYAADVIAALRERVRDLCEAIDRIHEYVRGEHRGSESELADVINAALHRARPAQENE